MGSNVIKFPDRRSVDRGTGKPVEITPTPKKLNLADRRVIGMFLVAMGLFSLNFKFFGSTQLGKGESRGVASVGKDLENSHHISLARRLASTEIVSPKDSSVGLQASMEDQVRHGVLASKHYVFLKDLEEGTVVSIRLQSETDDPAYFRMTPENFVNQYGPWLNSQFQSAELKSETKDANNNRVSVFSIYTQSGEEFELRIERDHFQRLKLISQTQVAGNSFN